MGRYGLLAQACDGYGPHRSCPDGRCGIELRPSRLGAALATRRKAPTGPLSPRELGVLRLIALGHTNQEIAEELIISTRTTEMHRANIMRKLRFQTRAQLVNYALANGLIGLV